MRIPAITPQRRRELEQYAQRAFSDLEWNDEADLFFSQIEFEKYVKPPTKKELKQREKDEREFNREQTEHEALAPRTPLELVILLEIENERKQAKINADAIAVRRGKKNIDATSKGGKETAKRHSEKAEVAIKLLSELQKRNPHLSISRCRELVGAQLVISEKTLERRAKSETAKK